MTTAAPSDTGRSDRRKPISRGSVPDRDSERGWQPTDKAIRCAPTDALPHHVIWIVESEHSSDAHRRLRNFLNKSIQYRQRSLSYRVVSGIKEIECSVHGQVADEIDHLHEVVRGSGRDW